MGPRLCEPAARGSQEAGFTQPRAHSFAQPCTCTPPQVAAVDAGSVVGRTSPFIENLSAFMQLRFFALPEGGGLTPVGNLNRYIFIFMHREEMKFPLSRWDIGILHFNMS